MAVNDPRVPDGWLQGSALEVKSEADSFRVIYVLEEPRDHSEWPEPTCAVEHGDQITALEWLVSHEGDILAMSPAWQDVSCLGS